MHSATNRPTGMFAFIIVWLGQLVSVLGTNMTQFALTIWVYQKTSSLTALALQNVFHTRFQPGHLAGEGGARAAGRPAVHQATPPAGASNPAADIA